MSSYKKHGQETEPDMLEKSNNNVQPLGMAWYKFLVSFSLIVGAVINIIYSFGYILGSIYLVQTNGQVTAEQVYAHYGKGLQFVDVFYGAFILAFAIFAIVVEISLFVFAIT